MLDSQAMKTVLEYLRDNGATTLLRLKKDTGLYGTSLIKTLQACPDIFILTENQQKSELNTEGEFGADITQMLQAYENRQRRKQNFLYMAIAGFGLLLVLLLVLAGMTSDRNERTDPATIPVPVDTAL